MELGDGLKKLLLAGVGTVAVTAEKSKEILDELVKKGELTVEQGKVLNQELKHTIKETIKTTESTEGRHQGYPCQTFTGAACRTQRADPQDGSTKGRGRTKSRGSSKGRSSCSS